MDGFIVDYDQGFRLSVPKDFKLTVPKWMKDWDNAETKDVGQCDPSEKNLEPYKIAVFAPSTVAVGEKARLTVGATVNEAALYVLWEVVDPKGKVREFIGSNVEVSFCAAGEAKVKMRVIYKKTGRAEAKGSASIKIIDKGKNRGMDKTDKANNQKDIWKYPPIFTEFPMGCYYTNNYGIGCNINLGIIKLMEKYMHR